MRRWMIVLAPFLILLAGCVTAPVPEEMIPMQQAPALPPLRLKEIVRLLDAGISEDVIVELIEHRDLAGRVNLDSVVGLKESGVGTPVIRALLAKPPPPRTEQAAEAFVYREFFIPLWPNYSGGRWHLGIEAGCWYRRPQLLQPPEELEDEFLPARMIIP